MTVATPRAAPNREQSAARRLPAWAYLLPAALLPIAVFFPRLLHGGFASDDWSNLAAFSAAPLDESIDKFAAAPFGYRSLLPVYAHVYTAVLADHITGYMALSLLSIVVFAVLIAMLLRRVGVVPWVAGFAAGLGAIFPYATITKIWFTSHFGHVSGAFGVGGVLVALRGLRAKGWWRQAAWHAVALVLYLVSVLMYEITMPFLAGAGLLYLWVIARGRVADGRPWRGEWWPTYRGGLIRWAADLVVLGGWYLQLGSAAPAEDPNFNLAHRLGLILGDGAKTFAGGFVPFLAAERNPATGEIVYSGALFTPSQVTVVCAGVAAVAVLSLLVGVVVGGRFAALRYWGVGILLATALGFAGWLAIIPANDYYRPVPSSIDALRVNVLAAFGLAGAVVCVVGALGTLAGALVGERGGSGVRTVTIALGITFVVVGYWRHAHSEVRIWNDANEQARATLDATKEALGPSPKRGTTVLLTDSVEYLPGGAEVFFVPWAFNGALRAMYDDPTLVGVTHYANERIQCRADGVAPYGTFYWRDHPGKSVPYGDTAVFVRTQPVRTWRITDRKTCQRAVREAGLAAYEPGPDAAPFGEPTS